MARYSSLLKKRVEVQYRAGDIQLPATATLVGDSGRSIFLEEHVFQNGTVKSFRWEIPYQSIVAISECAALVAAEPEPAKAGDPASPSWFHLKDPEQI